MHQDQRIGLALAVLLLGAAGAFFFRNDPKPTHASPRLKSAREIDERISEMQNVPYLSIAEEDDESPGTRATEISDRREVSEEAGRVQPGRRGTADNSRTDAGRSRAAFADESVQELAPIPFPPGVIENAPEEALSQRQAAKVETISERIHVVQKGDTLSSIAAKELGTSTRFHEIFEANRDQLKDANDVRIGMNLRLPSRQPNRNEDALQSRSVRPKASAPPLLPSETPAPGDATPTPLVPDPEPQPSDRQENQIAPKKRFEPAKRVPLGAQGMGAQSTSVDKPLRPTRKLTQLPPKDGGGKIAR